MTDCRIEHITADSEYYAALRELWCDTFDDEPAYVDAVYSKLQAEGYAVADTAESGSSAAGRKLLSAVTVYEAGSLDGTAVDVLYAVCTRIDKRGLGYASRLVEHCWHKAHDSERLMLAFPVEPSLTDYYLNLGIDLICSAENIETEAEGIPINFENISASVYNEYRESFFRISGMKHIALSEQFAKFIGCEYRLVLINNGDAIAAVDISDPQKSGAEDSARLLIPELIVNPRLLERSGNIDETIAGALAAEYGKVSAVYRTVGSGDTSADGEKLYFGFPLD